MYEDRYARSLRRFWSITVIIDSRLGIVTNGRAATLDQAKGKFRDSWDRVRRIRSSRSMFRHNRGPHRLHRRRNRRMM
jgi:hypothetical protein